MKALLTAALIAFKTLCASSAFAHELRPAFLHVREMGAEEYAVTWKVPALGDRRLALYVQLPPACKVVGEKVGTIQDAAYYERWNAHCSGGIKGQTIAIEGLRTSLTDALARVQYSGGETQSVRLTPEAPAFVASGSQSAWEVAQAYLGLGVEHILTGLDHLLFVLALILLIKEPWMLVKSITAFTVAHSITLAGSALGYFSLPQRPVEATIALSIAFIASELVKTRTDASRTADIYPWLLAFCFGLLHGFGFAGALTEIGLPQNEIPLALLFFNVGVEIGQLIFVAAILLFLHAVRSLFARHSATARSAAGYMIGIVAATWFIFRMSTFG